MVIDLRIEGIRYEVDSLVRMLLPDRVIRMTEGSAEPIPAEEDCLLIEAEQTTKSVAHCRIFLRLDGHETEDKVECPADTHSMEQSVCRILYARITELQGRELPWGMLTGVRPVKLVRQAFSEGKSEAEITRLFREYYRVSPERISLSMQTWEHQQDLFWQNDPHEFSLYLSIPFCPSRCSYCSFVSHSIEKTARLVPEYVEALLREIRSTAALVAKNGLRLVTIYMGGGTPTTLSAQQMDCVLSEVRACFDLTHCREFTVEAGRPDTVTREKLEILAKNGVTRISINPQTLNNEVLQNIGRRHTVEEFFAAYQMAREFPFWINVDLIAGLPGDDITSFCRSVDGILSLRPQNITVHTLTIKHAAELHDETWQKRTAYEMVEYSRTALENAGYQPYYLYRQKGTVDSLENVGYSLGETRCLYNVYIMDDSHTIISVGAGGVTKLILPQGGRIQRYFNFKYPYEYISRFDSVLERKQSLPLQSLF